MISYLWLIPALFVGAGVALVSVSLLINGNRASRDEVEQDDIVSRRSSL